MQKTPIIIDIFVHVVDNYGDMGFACEFILMCQCELGKGYEYSIWTNDIHKVYAFVRQAGVLGVLIGDIVDFWNMRKSAIWIFLLHSPIPNLDLFEEKALILRIDYLSLDPIWIQNNEKEHILSTPDRQIIELIPSPLIGSAGIIWLCSWISKIDTPKENHISIFAYSETLNYFDWESFPDDIIVYVFWKVNSERKNIIPLGHISIHDFYLLIDTSQFVIIRGEVSFAHVIQGSVPFFWNIYKSIGGFPSEQSKQFLSMIEANSEYRKIHQILNGQRKWIITYKNILSALSWTRFPILHIQDLILTVKKYIDRFHNSI